MSRPKRFVWLLICLVAIAPAGTLAQPAKGKRVKPPTFEPASVEEIFFPDVFAVLVGSRPDNQAVRPNPVAAAPGGPSAPTSSPDGSDQWSQWVTAATLENEIKDIKLLVDQEVTSVGAFAGRGHLQCRRLFSLAAVFFGVIEQFDKDVRWKNDASGIRQLFARTGFNCKTGDKRVFDQARARKAELQDLLNGQIPATDAAEPIEDWSKVADRQPLMQRLDFALNQRIQAIVSSDGAFRAGTEDLRHEAETLAVLGEVLARPEMEDSGDATYAGFARHLRDSSRRVVRSIESLDYEEARAAVGEISKACTDCHDGYKE